VKINQVMYNSLVKIEDSESIVLSTLFFMYPEWLSVSEIVDYSSLLRPLKGKKPKNKKVSDIIEKLLDMGIAELLKDGKRKYYRINPDTPSSLFFRRYLIHRYATELTEELKKDLYGVTYAVAMSNKLTMSTIWDDTDLIVVKESNVSDELIDQKVIAFGDRNGIGVKYKIFTIEEMYEEYMRMSTWVIYFLQKGVINWDKRNIFKYFVKDYASTIDLDDRAFYLRKGKFRVNY